VVPFPGSGHAFHDDALRGLSTVHSVSVASDDAAGSATVNSSRPARRSYPGCPCSVNGLKPRARKNALQHREPAELQCKTEVRASHGEQRR